MRFVLPLFVILSVSAFHTVFPACVESAENEEKAAIAEHDGLAELKKIDQLEFEAALREKAAQINVTAEEDEKPRYLEADLDAPVAEHGKAEVRAGNSDAADQGDESESVSSEEREGTPRVERQEVVTVSILDVVSQESSEERDGSQ